MLPLPLTFCFRGRPPKAAAAAEGCSVIYTHWGRTAARRTLEEGRGEPFVFMASSFSANGRLPARPLIGFRVTAVPGSARPRVSPGDGAAPGYEAAALGTQLPQGCIHGDADPHSGGAVNIPAPACPKAFVCA